jgi:hypothetical protein
MSVVKGWGRIFELMSGQEGELGICGKKNGVVVDWGGGR